MLKHTMDDWDYFADLLRKNIPFSFAKFNDGEISSIVSPDCVISRGYQKNCPTLSNNLYKALVHNQEHYYVGLPCKQCYPSFADFSNKQINHSNYTAANIFLNSNLNKSIRLFEELFPNKRIAVVCSEKAKTDNLPFSPYLIYKTPNSDSWSVFDKVKTLITSFSSGDIVLLMCGPLGRVLCYEWFKQRKDITFIELGSFYDPLTIKKSYLYHEGVLAYCPICNPVLLDELLFDIRECRDTEFVYYANVDDYSLVYNNHSKSIYRAYKRRLGYIQSENYYCYCKMVEYSDEKDTYDLCLQISRIYPKRAEHVIKGIERLQDKELKDNLYKTILDLPNPNEEYKGYQPELYDWKILDDYVIFTYYKGDYRSSYKYWELLMQRKDKIPSCHIERVTDNGRYAKLFIDEENELIPTYNTFIKELECHPKYNLTHDKIPKYFHFIYIDGGVNFCMMHYLAIRTCYDIQKPDHIYLYTNKEPDNIWWKKSKQYATVIIVTIPRFVNGHRIDFKQHQADLMRLHILNKIGGVYMDIDILSLHNLDCTTLQPVYEDKHNGYSNLYDNQTVMCREAPEKLVNCVIMSRKNNHFIQEWIDQYEKNYGIHPDWWGGLSVVTPNSVAEQFPAEISILCTKFFIPFLFNDWRFFKEADITKELKESFTVHLWETEARKGNLIPEDEDYFKTNDNTFTKLFKHYFENNIKAHHTP